MICPDRLQFFYCGSQVLVKYFDVLYGVIIVLGNFNVVNYLLNTQYNVSNFKVRKKAQLEMSVFYTGGAAADETSC